MRIAALVFALFVSIAVPVSAATERVGSIDGVAIIDRLTADDLAGGVHRFWFRAGETALAQSWLVPVIVVKGSRPGPKLLVTAGIHGDELNGIAVIHRLAATDPAMIAGTLVMVPGLNTPGLTNSTREWTPNDSRASANLNREMPGSDGGRGVEDVAGRLWSRLLRPNATTAVDLHTQSRGTAYVMYAFASTPRTRAMADLMAPDIIKLDPGEKGTVENELTRDGVPAITLELGRPEIFDAAMIGRATAGVTNLMRDLGMVAGRPVPKSPLTFTGNIQTAVRAPRAGFATLLTPLGTDVTQGQVIAVMTDAFGRRTETIVAPVTGRISTSFTDPRRERGSMIVRIIHNSNDPKCAMGC